MVDIDLEKLLKDIDDCWNRILVETVLSNPHISIDDKLKVIDDLDLKKSYNSLVVV